MHELKELEDAIKEAWERWHGPVRQDEGDGFTPSVSPVFRQGFKDGFALAEQKMREALRGHKSSELWGEHGLIAAVMRCVDAVQRKEEEGKTEGVHHFTEEEKECLRHALMHLEHNKILENLGYGCWYCGNRKQFAARHKKALAVLRGFLGETENNP
jgi:hypothetical protein